MNERLRDAALLRTSDAAKLLGVSTPTLRSWRLRGQGPAWIDLGSERGTIVRYSLVALREFIAQREIRPTDRRRRIREQP
jgi:hypothetical protein